MDSSKDHFDQQQPPSSGAFSDLKRLQSNGAATAAELREFLGHLKGHNPQEVMGIVAQSGLVRATFTATIGCLVLLFVGTIIPYALYGGSSRVSDKVTPRASDNPPPTAATTTPAPAETATVSEAAQPAAAPDLQRAAEAMGIGEAAEPDTNALDNKLDKLLDGID